MYLINFTATRKKFYLSLHYNGDNSYLFTKGTETIKFKKGFRDCSRSIVPRKHFRRLSSADMKKTGLYGSVFDFSVDYRVTPLDDIVDIHKYLMKKMAYNIKCLDLLERYFLQQWHFLVLVD